MRKHHLPCFTPIPSWAIFGLTLIAATALRGDDVQNWQNLTVTWPKIEQVALETSAEWRLTDDLSDLSYWRIRQAIATRPFSWLTAGAAYRYTESKNSEGHWRDQHRLELELTPRWKLDEQVTLSLRNRMEFRWNESVRGRNERTRHRLQLAVNTPQWRAVKSVYASHETIYDWDRKRIAEHRTIPLGLKFEIRESAELSLFYMLRVSVRDEEWTHTHVIGTSLSLSL